MGFLLWYNYKKTTNNHHNKYFQNSINLVKRTWSNASPPVRWSPRGSKRSKVAVAPSCMGRYFLIPHGWGELTRPSFPYRAVWRWPLLPHSNGGMYLESAKLDDFQKVCKKIFAFGQSPELEKTTRTQCYPEQLHFHDWFMTQTMFAKSYSCRCMRLQRAAVSWQHVANSNALTQPTLQNITTNKCFAMLNSACVYHFYA